MIAKPRQRALLQIIVTGILGNLRRSPNCKKYILFGKNLE